METNGQGIVAERRGAVTYRRCPDCQGELEQVEVTEGGAEALYKLIPGVARGAANWCLYERCTSCQNFFHSAEQVAEIMGVGVTYFKNRFKDGKPIA